MERAELINRVTEHLRQTPIPAKQMFADVDWPHSSHSGGDDGHLYDGACALCRMDIPEALPRVVEVVLDFLAALDEEAG